MFEFASPWLLLLLPLPWLFRYLMPVAKLSTPSALKVPFFQTLKQMIQGTPNRQQRAKWWAHLLAYLIWGLLIIAASGPEWLGKPIELPRSGRDLMLAIDLSGSMQIPDMITQNRKQPVNRLVVVKKVAGQFIKQRKGDRVGLILFGSKAYLQTPLTFDLDTVAAMLDDATLGLAGTQTAIGDAIGLTIKRLQTRSTKNRILVLLTDGVSNSGNVDPLSAARVASEQGIRIYTIGIGADKMTTRTIIGNQSVNPSASLDEDTLKAIAKLTGGFYFRAKDQKGLSKIYHELNKLEPVVSDKAVFRPTHPLYPWPLALALFLTIGLALQKAYSFRRQANAS